MLAWMIVSEELRPYFTSGSVVGRASLISIMSPVEGFDAGGSMADRDALIAKEWSSDFANKLLGKRLDDSIEDDHAGWSSKEEPRQASAGTVLFATDIDWEGGVLEGEYPESTISSNEFLFWDRDELFVSAFPDPDYIVRLEGLSFPLDRIELLRPTTGEGVLIHSKSTAATRIGRPQKWDWEGAMATLVAAAQHPDGLPTGPGAQAKIEKLIAEWFIEETGDAPSASQVRQRASTLIRRMTKPESKAAF
jgi:hypothetical protein